VPLALYVAPYLENCTQSPIAWTFRAEAAPADERNGLPRFIDEEGRRSCTLTNRERCASRQRGISIVREEPHFVRPGRYVGRDNERTRAG